MRTKRGNAEQGLCPSTTIHTTDFIVQKHPLPLTKRFLAPIITARYSNAEQEVMPNGEKGRRGQATEILE